jgi:hypothetical protein
VRKRLGSSVAPAAALVFLAAAAPACAADPPAAPASDCRGCHADAHPGFERSGHALAATEPWYARSLALSPPALARLCARCHAPDAERPRAGVTCETCHGGPEAAHARRAAREPALDPRLCERCHVVDLPLGKDGAWVHLQDTPAEHALWRERTGDPRGCVDCHASPLAAHFAGVRDPDFLAGAVAVSIVPEDAAAAAGEVRGEVRLENLAGHAFPGGSRLREAWVRLALVAADGRRAEVLAERLSWRGDAADGDTPVDLRLAPGEMRRFPFRAAIPAAFAGARLALECAVDLALVSLDFPDSHPMIPPGEPRVVPVSRARVALVSPSEGR